MVARRIKTRSHRKALKRFPTLRDIAEAEKLARRVDPKLLAMMNANVKDDA